MIRIEIWILCNIFVQLIGATDDLINTIHEVKQSILGNSVDSTEHQKGNETIDEVLLHDNGLLFFTKLYIFLNMGVKKYFYSR
ncbi:hypothetical protein MNBD_GAMMA22-1722 [hydrothermal vent metagenome]|uniref:Uncharacterized protein n=1 Tax=hydrothermal vent metagenome TaxID=652676 RepID=A0A3B1A5I3_9ZZZZ